MASCVVEEQISARTILEENATAKPCAFLISVIDLMINFMDFRKSKHFEKSDEIYLFT